MSSSGDEYEPGPQYDPNRQLVAAPARMDSRITSTGQHANTSINSQFVGLEEEDDDAEYKLMMESERHALVEKGNFLEAAKARQDIVVREAAVKEGLAQHDAKQNKRSYERAERKKADSLNSSSASSDEPRSILRKKNRPDDPEDETFAGHLLGAALGSVMENDGYEVKAQTAGGATEQPQAPMPTTTVTSPRVGATAHVGFNKNGKPISYGPHDADAPGLGALNEQRIKAQADAATRQSAEAKSEIDTRAADLRQQHADKVHQEILDKQKRDGELHREAERDKYILEQQQLKEKEDIQAKLQAERQMNDRLQSERDRITAESAVLWQRQHVEHESQLQQMREASEARQTQVVWQDAANVTDAQQQAAIFI